MNIKKIEKSINELDDLIRNRYTDFENNVHPVIDGALDPSKYFDNSSFRMMWLLKEPYDKKDERTGCWSIPDHFMNNYDQFYKDLVRSKFGKTWQPVVYASYGILNGFKSWKEMPYIWDEPEMVRILGKVAWVNIHKLPSLTGSSTHIGNIIASYRQNGEVLKEQIQLLDPDIIICGNTFSVVKEDWGNPKEEKFDMVEYCTIGKRLIVNAYHPAQRTITRERYINNIVECVKQWSEIRNIK